MNIKEIIKESLQTMNEGWDGNLDESFGGLSVLEPIVGKDALKSVLKTTGTSQDSSYEQIPVNFKTVTGIANGVKRILQKNKAISCILFLYNGGKYNVIYNPDDDYSELKSTTAFKISSTDSNNGALTLLKDMVKKDGDYHIYVFFDDPVKVAKKEQRLANKSIDDPYAPNNPARSIFHGHAINKTDSRFMSNAKIQADEKVKEIKDPFEIVQYLSVNTIFSNKKAFKYGDMYLYDIGIDGKKHGIGDIFASRSPNGIVVASGSCGPSLDNLNKKFTLNIVIENKQLHTKIIIK